ncbi:MAG: sodium:solute symporter family protein [Planctomycetota bacterium]
MALHPLDWAVILVAIVAVVGIGLVKSKSAGQSVDNFFLSGRTLPWWLTGTSMVATSFSIDTPLFVTGIVRQDGIWKNWLWWCYLVGGMLAVFLFARWWRRGGVMTKAELAELRYGGRDGKLLRGVLGVLHATIVNTLILSWVLLAAAKVMEVLLGVPKEWALLVCCSGALLYSMTSGFWGVVLTDLPQLVIAMTGAVVLAALSWDAVGGVAGVQAALAAATAGSASVGAVGGAVGGFPTHALDLLPPTGAGSVFDASFWTVPLATLAVYLGISWWAVENVDGSGATVQRIAASRDERQGVLAVLWFNFAHYALRPWPWILVALASLVVLPPLELRAPAAGTVRSVDADGLVIALDGAADHAGAVHAPGASVTAIARVEFAVEGSPPEWQPEAVVRADATVQEGQVVARTDPEKAYVAMMRRYLPAGLLGLVIAGLLAAFMSTVDTHVNLAASFFVNDVWRRFVKPGRSDRHYVAVARWASAGAMALGALLAWQSDSISTLFVFFLAFLAGVGPVYVMRWFWWRVRAAHEIVAMFASAATATALTFWWGQGWPAGPLAPDGVLSDAGRTCLVAAVSITAVLVASLFIPAADPRALLPFYRRIRPMGFWGPVAALAPEVVRPRGELGAAIAGVLGGLALVWGAMLALGLWLLERGAQAAVAAAVAFLGAALVRWALARIGAERGR